MLKGAGFFFSLSPTSLHSRRLEYKIKASMIQSMSNMEPLKSAV